MSVCNDSKLKTLNNRLKKARKTAAMAAFDVVKLLRKVSKEKKRMSSCKK